MPSKLLHERLTRCLVTWEIHPLLHERLTLCFVTRDSLSVTWETPCQFCYISDALFCYMRDSFSVLLHERLSLSALLYKWHTVCFVVWEIHYLFCYIRNSVTCRRHCIFVTCESRPLLYYMKDKLFCYLKDPLSVLLHERLSFVTWDSLLCDMSDRLSALNMWEIHYLFCYMKESHESLWFVTWETHCLLCYTRHLLLFLFAWDPKWFVYFSFNVSILNLFIETEETCSDEMFDCNGDKKKCIHRDLVCNYINDCGNWNDEASELCNGKCVLKYVT